MKEIYGAQPPIELIRQWMDHGGWYDKKAVGVFKNILDVNFVCAIGPPGGGRTCLTPRLLRHFNFLSFPELEDSCKATIFCSILGAWLGLCTNLQVDRADLRDRLVGGTISMFSTIISKLLPTPSKSHYVFNLRDISKVFHGIILTQPDSISSITDVVKLWYHECCRVFQDRLVSIEDRDWLGEKMKERVSEFGVGCSEVDNLLYGRLCKEDKSYTEIRDHAKIPVILQEYMDDYNRVNTPKLDVIFFRDTIQHVCRVSRIIRQPQGSAILLGVTGDDRQSLVRLASHMVGYSCVQIEMSRMYGVKEWRESVKSVLMRSGIEDTPAVLLFSDTERSNELFIEYLNSLLCSGDIPSLYSPQDMDVICNSIRPVVEKAGLRATESNVFAEYIRRVRDNCHFVICMSPVGDLFRCRIRKFPNLVNCCNIDWFSEWSCDSLRSVADTHLRRISELYRLPYADGLVGVCVDMHQSVMRASIEYTTELDRQSCVTSVSYMELLRLFQSILAVKMSELNEERDRVSRGLDKLLSTVVVVSGLQTEVEKAQVKEKLVATQRRVKAQELMGVLQDETAKWRNSITRLDKLQENIIGDVLLASGAVAYFGSFTDNFRDSLTQVTDYVIHMLLGVHMSGDFF